MREYNRVFTRDEAALILDMFERVLDTYEIKIPSPEDDEREPDNEAKLYGSVYYDLLDEVESSLVDLIGRCSDYTDIVINEFSGEV